MIKISLIHSSLFYFVFFSICLIRLTPIIQEVQCSSKNDDTNNSTSDTNHNDSSIRIIKRHNKADSKLNSLKKEDSAVKNNNNNIANSSSSNNNNNKEAIEISKNAKEIIDNLHFLQKVQNILDKDNLGIPDLSADEGSFNPDIIAPKEELEKLKFEDSEEAAEIEYSISNSSKDPNINTPKVVSEKTAEIKRKALTLIISENEKSSPSFFQESFLQKDVISFLESKGTLSHLDSVNSLVIDLYENTTDEEVAQYIKELEEKGAFVESDQIVGADSIDLTSFLEAVRNEKKDIKVKDYELFLETENNEENSLDTEQLHSQTTKEDEEVLSKLESENKTKFKFNDEYRNLLWGLDMANMDNAVDLIKNNQLVHTKICIIDTGVDYTHPDLVHTIDINLKEFYGTEGKDDDNNGIIDDIYGVDFFNGDSDPMDDNYHGTHIAGIISAMSNNNIGVAGVDANAKLIICKALDKNKIGRIGYMLKCIDYCVKRGANIINGSISFDQSSRVFNAAINSIKKKGILMTVSASNCVHSKYMEPDLSKCDLSNTPKYPSVLSVKYNNILTVGNLKENIDKTYELSIYSFYSPIYCQLAAPGTNIYSTTPHGTYKKLNGTSMAAPHVAAIASLIYSINPNLDYLKVIDILKNSLIPLDSIKDKTKWGGYVDIPTAVNQALKSVVYFVKSENSKGLRLGGRKKRKFFL